MHRLLLVFTFFLILSSCSEDNNINPQKIIDKAIAISGGENYKNLEIEFSFRELQYRSKLQDGNFEYERLALKSNKTILDAYGNVKPFERFVNDTLVKIPDSLSNRIESSINSVNYFVLLPFGLNDPAVNKKYLDKEMIKGKDYHKIQVTFNKEGGGEDFDDVYVYWFDTKNYKIAYLAYSYTVNGGGMRFKEAYNERIISGLRFVDYNNYKPKDKNISLYDLGRLFENNQLKLLSKIETENIKIH